MPASFDASIVTRAHAPCRPVRSQPGIGTPGVSAPQLLNANVVWLSALRDVLPQLLHLQMVLVVLPEGVAHAPTVKRAVDALLRSCLYRARHFEARDDVRETAAWAVEVGAANAGDTLSASLQNLTVL